MLRNDFLVLAIYDNSDYTLVSYIEKPTYVEHLPTYNEGGKFKIVAQITEQNAQCIKKGYFVHIESNVIGVIDYINLSSNNTMTLGGTLGDKLLSQRYIFESSDISNTSPSDAIEEVYDDLTAIPSVTFVDYTQYSGDPINVSVEPKDFLSFVQDLCQKYEIGYRIVAETTNPLTLNFELYEGQDKSSSVIMSKNFESISDFECTSSSEDQVNYVKVLGQNNIEVEVTTTPAPTGTDLCEYLLDCSRIEQGSMTEAEYRTLLTEKGQEVINKHKVKTTYSGSYTGLTFRYGTDYSLGDIVSAKDSHLDIDTQQRITGYVKQFDSSGIYLSLKFGEKQDTISAISHDLIKRVEAIEHKEDSTPAPSGGSVIDSHRNIIGGENNIIPDSTSCKDNLVVGDGNEFRNTTQGNIVGGWHNILSFSNHNLCLGSSNYLHSAYDALVAGTQNDVSSTNSITVGKQLNNAVHYCLMIGEKATSSGTDRIVVGNGTSAAQRRTFRVEADGTTYAKVYNTTGADYAEYFEWSDGNPKNEDRRGMLVTFGGTKQKTYIHDDMYNEDIEILQSDKIVFAHGDEILGAVSCRPSVIGNAYDEHWHGKYKLDVFGDYILDDDGKPQLSDDYDPEREYIPRSQRQEWVAVGLLGKVIINDNGQCQPGKPIRVIHGIAVPAQNNGIKNVIVLRRLDENHIEVLIK